MQLRAVWGHHDHHDASMTSGMQICAVWVHRSTEFGTMDFSSKLAFLRKLGLRGRYDCEGLQIPPRLLSSCPQWMAVVWVVISRGRAKGQNEDGLWLHPHHLMHNRDAVTDIPSMQN